MVRVGTVNYSGTAKVGSRTVLAVICVVAGSACSRIDVPAATPATPVTLTIGYPHVTGQDPLHGMQQAARLISFEGLVLPSRDGRVQPRLAESWVESPDGLEWRFKLRSNAFFHDGSAVEAVAVRDSLERSLANADEDQYPGLADIIAIEARGRLDLVIRLRARSTFLLDDLGVSIQKPIPGNPPAGTGPYVADASPGTELTMTAFPKYYRGTPSIERIVWKAYPTVRTAWAAMMRGEIDFLYEVGEEAKEFVEGEASTETFSFLRNYVYGVMFNLKRSTFHDARVRRALNYAVNRRILLEHAFKGHGQETSGSAWPEHWAYDASVGKYSYDPARAAALLDSTLPKQNANQQRPQRPPARLHFSCTFPENFALWEHMALLVQRDLAAIGVDMELETVSVAEFNQRIATGDFEAVLLELIVGNTASRPYTFWYSQSRRDFTGYKNTRVDAAFDAIRRASNDVEYRAGFSQFQTLLLEDPPAIFLAIGSVTRAVSKRFQVMAPPGSDILPTIADWRVASQAAGTTN